MKILHICSYYIGNELYSNMFRQLSIEGVHQEIFIPIKHNNQIGKNQLPDEIIDINYYYKPILKKHDRFLYHSKILKQKKEIEKVILNTNSIDFVHAHTVFSDGGTAYKLYEEYNIDYIINVRNTDINWYFKYAFHLRPFMYKVLLSAKKIVFISYAYKSNLLDLLPAHITEKVIDKCVVIPNGIDDYWHNQIKPAEKKPNDIFNLLFIGTLNKNKNLYKVLEACAILNRESQVRLDVIGNGPDENEIFQYTKDLGIDSIVTFHGFIKSKSRICEIMDKNHIFVMPSYKETFGLVYIEAMSRGLPVIYSKGQGIDGFFQEGEVGFSVDPHKVEEIVSSIKKIVYLYDVIFRSCLEKAKVFSWASSCKSYQFIYNNNSIEGLTSNEHNKI